VLDITDLSNRLQAEYTFAHTLTSVIDVLYQAEKSSIPEGTQIVMDVPEDFLLRVKAYLNTQLNLQADIVIPGQLLITLVNPN
jgi:hypothetical protein